MIATNGDTGIQIEKYRGREGLIHIGEYDL